MSAGLALILIGLVVALATTAQLLGIALIIVGGLLLVAGK